MQHGFVKIAAATPQIQVANPVFNARQALDMIEKCAERKAKIIVLPELCLSSASAGDLFLQEIVIKESRKALEWLAVQTKETDALIFAGLPWRNKSKLYNVTAVFNRGKVLALIPKSAPCKNGSTGRQQYFAPAEETTERITAFGYEIPLGTKILLQAEQMEELTVACEIGNDLEMIYPPSLAHASAGAVIVVNPFAQAEAVTAQEMRKITAMSHSRRLAAAYIMSGAGEGESTQDMVFGGHKVIAENGKILGESYGAGEEILFQDIDVSRLLHERCIRNTFHEQGEGYCRVGFSLKIEESKLDRKFSAWPFVPQKTEERNLRLESILQIQASGLKKRLMHTGCKQVVIGLSGGLDSTLALLVTVRAFDMLHSNREGIRCVTMPCFGTTDRTYDNACRMAEKLGTVLERIDIKEAVTLHFRDIKQEMDNHNVTYENSQARERTQVLMDIANRENALVIGTGDMSELALGWATYNGDHMSMYGVNAGVPKTLVRHLVKYYADTCEEEELREVLYDVLDTPVSPELLPPAEGKIVQKTEDLVGPYQLHDFFLYYMLRFGYEPEKIYRIAVESFQGQYKEDEISKWLKIFCRRFFTQQFKRSCLPDGPKVGSVCVSPRGGLCMPSDAASDLWLQPWTSENG